MRIYMCLCMILFAYECEPSGKNVRPAGHDAWRRENDPEQPETTQDDAGRPSPFPGPFVLSPTRHLTRLVFSQLLSLSRAVLKV